MNLNVFVVLIKIWEYVKISFGEQIMIGESIEICFLIKVVIEWRKYD